MYDVTELLIQPASEGYPTEYLLARIRGRRAALATELSAVITAEPPSTPLRYRFVPAGVAETEGRQEMQGEFRWVYGQMNEGLRQAFAPLFLWFELRTIIICLRFRRGGKPVTASGILASSLLAERFKRVLGGEGEPSAVTETLADMLAAVAEPYRDLGRIYRQRGERGAEQHIFGCYLEQMAGPPVNPVLREFFRALTDMRNLVALAKQIRWQMSESSVFIRQGTIPPERLVKALEEGTTAGLAALIRTLPGMGALPSAPANPEPLLFGWLGRRLRLLGRDPLGIGLILEYLWQCFIKARNRSLLFHGEALDRETLNAEFVT